MHRKKVLKMEYASWWDPYENDKMFIANIKSKPDLPFFVPPLLGMYISCDMMYSLCCCWRVDAHCGAAIVTVRTNQKNFSEASLSCISTIWFILVSLLLLKSKFVCIFMYQFYLGWEFRKLVFFHMVPIISCEYKRDLNIQDQMHKIFTANQKSEPDLLT
jgi:hypothetical protein